MVVKAQYERLRISGLYVGIGNVRRHFSKRMPVVELQLDHLRIQCVLSPHFWNGQPEIKDPRLCGWLEAKLAHAGIHHAPMLMSLTPSGKNSFMLAPIDTEHAGLEMKTAPRAGTFGKPRPIKSVVAGEGIVAASVA